VISDSDDRHEFSFRVSRLNETPHEHERRVRDLAPATVDRERVTAIGDLDDFGHALLRCWRLNERVRDRPWDRVVLLAGDDQRGRAQVLGVDLRLGPWIELAVAA